MGSYRGAFVNPTLWEFVQAIEHGPDCYDMLCGKFIHLAREFPNASIAAFYQIIENRYGIYHPITVVIADAIAGEMERDNRPQPAPSVDPATDAFLQSFEWRRVRMEVLEERGAICECCGRTPRDGITINVDHVKNRKKHPELALTKTNLQILCNECNHGKGNKFITDWRSRHDHRV